MVLYIRSIYQCYVFACLVNFCNFHNYFMLFHAEFFNKINNQLNYWDTFIVPWSNCHNYAVFEFGKITAIKSCYYHAWVFFRSTFSNATCFESRMMTGNFIFKTFSTKWQLFHTNGKLTKLLQALSPKILPFFKNSWLDSRMICCWNLKSYKTEITILIRHWNK